MQMKGTLLIVIAFAAFVLVTCVTNIDLTNYAQKSASFRDTNSEFKLINIGYQSFVSFHGDYFLAHSNNNDDYVTTLMIFKYDALLEKYDYVVGLNVTLLESFVPKTNGKWFGTYEIDNSRCILFQLGSPNLADISPTYLDIENPLSGPRGMTIMPDDSVVVHYSYGLSTYTFNGTGWTLNNTLEVKLGEKFPWTSFDVTYTHMVCWNASGTFKIYARNQQLGWDLIEEHETDPSYTNRLTGNPDTRTTIVDEKTIMLRNLVAADPRDPNASDFRGFLIIFSKQDDGTWTDQIILPSNVTSNDTGYSFAWNAFVMDSNTVFISTPQEGDHYTNSSLGSVYLLRRNINGVWQVPMSFSRAVNGYFGAAMGINGDSVKMLGCEGTNTDVNCYPYTVKTCNLVEPNVTCNDISLTGCDTLDLSSLNYTALNAYTIHDDCGPVTIEYVDSTKGNGKITVTLSFNRPVSSAKSCDTTITCVASSVTPPVSTPVKSPVQKTSNAAQMSAVVLTLIILVLEICT